MDSSDDDEDMRIALQRSLNDAGHTDEEDEDMKRALEMSKTESVMVRDSDEEMERAIKLSLKSTEPIELSDDEYDAMCGNNDSLEDRMSQSSVRSSNGTSAMYDDLDVNVTKQVCRCSYLKFFLE